MNNVYKYAAELVIPDLWTALVQFTVWYLICLALFVFLNTAPQRQRLFTAQVFASVSTVVAVVAVLSILIIMAAI